LVCRKAVMHLGTITQALRASSRTVASNTLQNSCAMCYASTRTSVTIRMASLAAWSAASSISLAARLRLRNTMLTPTCTTLATSRMSCSVTPIDSSFSLSVIWCASCLLHAFWFWLPLLAFERDDRRVYAPAQYLMDHTGSKCQAVGLAQSGCWCDGLLAI